MLILCKLNKAYSEEDNALKKYKIKEEIKYYENKAKKLIVDE